MREALDRRVGGHLRNRSAHDFANDQLAEILALQGEIQNLVLENGAHGLAILEDGKLGNVLLLHGLQGLIDGAVGTDENRLARFAVLPLDADYIGGGEGDFRFGVAVLAHPGVVINFAEIAAAGIRQQRDDQIAFAAIAGHAESGRNAAAAGAAGEDAFALGQAARPEETFLVAYLQHVVEHGKIHGGRQDVLADAFDNIGVRLADRAGFRVLVEQRAQRIDADDFDRRIFFLEETADAGGRAAGAEAADEMGDLAFGIVPNFGAGEAVVRVGIGGIIVLVGEKRVGNFASELFRHGIIAARILGLDGSRTHDHLGAESF